MNKWVFLIAVACSIVLLHRAEAESPVDPVAGHWVWNNTLDVTLNADGTAHQHNGTGRWTLLPNDNHTIERKYRITWRKADGKIFIDTLVLSTNRLVLEGVNQHDRHIRGKRITD